MPTFYGPPSDGTVIPEQLETALAADIAAPESAIGGALSGRYASRAVEYPPPVAAWSAHMYRQRLPKWAAALDAVQAGTRDAKILCIGDSTTAGVGGNTAASSTFYSSWPHFLAQELDRKVVAAVQGLQVPGSISIATDTRWVAGAGWTKGADGVLGFGNKGMYWRGVPGSGSLVFSDNRINADRFDIYYVRIPGTGDAVISATATGGTTVTQNNRASGITNGDIAKFTVSAAVASSTNTLTITHSGTNGNITIVGVEPWLSTGIKRVRVGNAAASGTTSTNWAAIYNATNGWSTDGAIKAYAPDLTIIDLGVNDSHSTNNTAADTYRANLQTIAGWAAVSGDVVLKTMIPSGNDDAARLPNQAAYVAEIKAMGYPYINTNGQFGSFTLSNPAGFMSDNLHGSLAMYRRQGQDIATLLNV